MSALVWGQGAYGAAVYEALPVSCGNCEHLLVEPRHTFVTEDLVGWLLVCSVCGPASGYHRPGLTRAIVEPRRLTRFVS